MIGVQPKSNSNYNHKREKRTDHTPQMPVYHMICAAFAFNSGDIIKKAGKPVHHYACGDRCEKALHIGHSVAAAQI